MKLEFEFEMQDWMELQKNYLNNSRQFKRTKIIVISMLPILLCFLIIFDVMKNEFRPFSIILYSIISLLWGLFHLWFLPKRTLASMKKMIEEGDNSSILGHHEIIFDDTGFLHTQPESEQKIKWNGIKKLLESDKYYFLYNTAISAIVIPKEKLDVDLEELDKILKSNIMI
ncbi:MAG: YcxB family protein [bacterium]|nr:YcxB family protein [bacterium]